MRSQIQTGDYRFTLIWVVKERNLISVLNLISFCWEKFPFDKVVGCQTFPNAKHKESQNPDPRTRATTAHTIYFFIKAAAVSAHTFYAEASFQEARYLDNTENINRNTFIFYFQQPFNRIT